MAEGRAGIKPSWAWFGDFSVGRGFFIVIEMGCLHSELKPSDHKWLISERVVNDLCKCLDIEASGSEKRRSDKRQKRNHSGKMVDFRKRDREREREKIDLWRQCLIKTKHCNIKAYIKLKLLINELLGNIKKKKILDIIYLIKIL